RGFGAHQLRDTVKGRRHFLEELERRMQAEEAEHCGVREVEGLGLWTSLRRLCCAAVALAARRRRRRANPATF
ncbi:MAG: hypothetical protein ACR2OZ_02160, partial [Verrucomicrobiales bacterium]